MPTLFAVPKMILSTLLRTGGMALSITALRCRDARYIAQGHRFFAAK